MSSSLCVSAQTLTLTNYEAIVLAQNPSNYFTFDGGELSNCVVGGPAVTLTASPAAGSITGLQLAPDAFGNPSNSFYFTIGSDVIWDPSENNDHIISGGGTAANTSTATGSITFLFRSIDPGPPPSGNPGTHCVFAAAPNTDTASSNAFSLFFQNPTNVTGGALIMDFGDSSTTILAATNIVPDTWYYFALTYNEAATNTSGLNSNKATWYLGRLSGGGVLTSGVITCNTNSVAGDGTSFYICNLPTSVNSTIRNPGNGQINQFAVWNRQLSTNEILKQFTNLPNVALPPRSQYEIVVNNQSPAYYFTLDGTPVDSITGLVLSTNSMTTNRFGFSSLDYFEQLPGACYFPYGGNDALYTNMNLLKGGGTYTGSLGTGQGAISLLFHALANTNAISGQKFIYSAGGSTSTSNGFALFYEVVTDPNGHPAALKLRFGDSDVPILPGLNPALVSSPWYYLAMNYDETQSTNQVHWWLAQLPGGTLRSGSFTATNGSLAGEGDIFVIGNDKTFANGFRDVSASRASNGQVDQFAIWHRLLMTNEITAQFNALSVSAGPPPTLSIVLSGGNVVLSWPSSTDPAFALQSTPSLSSPAWSGAGTPAVVGTNNVVTNTISPNANFYRLSK